MVEKRPCVDSWPSQRAGGPALLEGGRGLPEVAAELGVSTDQLSTWRTEQLAAGWAGAFERKAETVRLPREVRRLEEENLILG